MNRRRFLMIAAGAGALAALGAPRQAAAGVHVWRGTALGAGARIVIDHPDAERLTAVARAEIARLEGVFSLYRPDSALARLNREGFLFAPPFELLECLGLCAAVHAASAGAFDPTIQPLWAAQAEAWSADAPPAPERLAALPRGWEDVRFDAGAIRLTRPGMALTLNGVAQGLIADRVAARLRAEGATDVMVDAGEIAAFGRAPADMSGPGASGWPITLAAGPRLTLQDGGLATSAPLGTVFDAPGRQGHILDPRTGAPAAPVWDQVSISAPSAALADALSTAACLMRDAAALSRMIAGFAGARIEAAIPRA